MAYFLSGSSFNIRREKCETLLDSGQKEERKKSLYTFWLQMISVLKTFLQNHDLDPKNLL